MPQIDLGQVVGPQGAQGEPGPQGAQGIQGPAGPAATINGVNALIIEAGNNIELSQSGSTTTLSVPTDAAPTEDSTKPVQSGGVAAALANKAPGGYGLGGNCVIIEDWNTAIKNGWYRNTTADPGNHTPDGFTWYGFVVNYEDTLIIQVAFHADSPTSIKSAIRTFHEGTWGEWQYTTPPRAIGVEYRIQELYAYNTPVYTKVINFGAAPNATSKTLGHGIASFNQCVEISGNIGGVNLIGHPHITGVNVTASEITIETDADLSGSNVYVILKYTKTSN